MIKSWSTARSAIALSSVKAEYSGIVKGASVGLGFQSALKDFEMDCGIVIKSDATAAIAVASRRGVGKVRRIEA